MAQPSVASVHAVDPFLTNMMVNWEPGPGEDPFIADIAAPVIKVNDISGKYYIHSLEDLLRDEARPRSPGQVPASGGFTVSTDSYTCSEIAYRHKMPDEVRASYQAPDGPDRAATGHVAKKIQIRKERLFADTFFVSTAWASANRFTGGTNFTQFDGTGSEPVRVIREYLMRAARRAGGFRPNVAVLGEFVAEVLMQHADFRGRLSDNDVKEVDLQFIARILGLKKVFVGKAMYNTALEGGTASYSSCFDPNDALFMYVTDSPSIDQPSAAYQFEWTGKGNGSTANPGPGVRQYRAGDEGEGSDYYDGRSYMDRQVISDSLGVFLTDATAISAS